MAIPALLLELGLAGLTLGRPLAKTARRAGLAARGKPSRFSLRRGATSETQSKVSFTDNKFGTRDFVELGLGGLFLGGAGSSILNEQEAKGDRILEGTLNQLEGLGLNEAIRGQQGLNNQLMLDQAMSTELGLTPMGPRAAERLNIERAVLANLSEFSQDLAATVHRPGPDPRDILASLV